MLLCAHSRPSAYISGPLRPLLERRAGIGCCLRTTEHFTKSCTMAGKIAYRQLNSVCVYVCVFIHCKTRLGKVGGAGLAATLLMWAGLPCCYDMKTWRWSMNRRRLWDKNSSLGPGQVPHSLTNLQQVTGSVSRPGSRSTSPRETVSLPCVEFKFKSPRPPAPASSVHSAGVLPASLPRQQVRSDCLFPSGHWFTGESTARARPSGMAAGMDYTGIRSRHNWLTEPASPKEKTHKSKEKRRRVRDIHVRPPTIVDPLPLIQSGSLMEDGLPLDGQCGHCGGMFSRLSIAHHMKWGLFSMSQYSSYIIMMSS